MQNMPLFVCFYYYLKEIKRKGTFSFVRLNTLLKAAMGWPIVDPKLNFRSFSSSPLKVHFSLSERSTHFSVLFQSLYSNQLLFHSRAQVPFFWMPLAWQKPLAGFQRCYHVLTVLTETKVGRHYAWFRESSDRLLYLLTKAPIWVPI